jgi:hypothetical protein
MADKATMADLGAAKEQRKNYAVGGDAARKIRNIRDDKERGQTGSDKTDGGAEHVHEECPSCTCKSARSKSAGGKIRQGDEREGASNKGAEKRAAGTADQRGGVYRK